MPIIFTYRPALALPTIKPLTLSLLSYNFWSFSHDFILIAFSWETLTFPSLSSNFSINTSIDWPSLRSSVEPVLWNSSLGIWPSLLYPISTVTCWSLIFKIVPEIILLAEILVFVSNCSSSSLAYSSLDIISHKLPFKFVRFF